LGNRTYTNRRYLDLLSRRVLVFDGAMGTSLQAQNLSVQDFGGEKTNGCNDYLVISHPIAIEKVHRSFLESGADVIETNSFRSNRLTLAEYGLQDKTSEINYEAAAIARLLADEYSHNGQIRFVAGSIGPSGKLPSMNDPELSNISFDDLSDIFRQQALGLIQGGVDLLLIETSQDILEVKSAITGIQQAFEESRIFLPIQAQVTLDTSGRMLLGTDIGAVLAILNGFPIDVIGLNCSTGPEHMREPLRYLWEHSPIPVSCIPNAGLPLNIDGLAVYPMAPQPFADALIEMVEKYNVNVVGGCCGTTPEHIHHLSNGLKNIFPQPRQKVFIPSMASAVNAQPLIQEPPPFLIGERLNTQGSRKFKDLILDQDFESVIDIARQQVENGAHGLDICTALTERSDEAESMRKIIKVLSPITRVPFIIDSTEPEVLEIALKYAPGRCLINSTNLENGQTKADQVFHLAVKFNAAVIALTIDEKGMAITADRKLEIARRIYDIAVNQHGLHPTALVFDALTFTLATGEPEYDRSAIETMDAIRLIKASIPDVTTSLGVSNVSFGLTPAARGVLNSVMLFHCVQAGLDMAIVNPSQITPYAELSEEERRLAEDLIFNSRQDALQRLIEYFESSGTIVKNKIDNQQVTLQKLTPQERLHWRILHRYKDNLEKDIDEIIQPIPVASQHNSAINILNNTLLPAMKEVGEKFGKGELILPFVLQSAEVMKKSVVYLENFLEKSEGVSKGLLVLATVYGDVHDIGKNLVKTILSNNGYQVVDLGKQVPADTIISKAVELNADAIGLSALLVSTSKQMPLIVNELQNRGLSIPVLIGGAAINQRFARRILLTEKGSIYESGVFYCKDAFEGLSTMEALCDKDKIIDLIKNNRIEAEIELGRVEVQKSVYQNPQAHTSVQPALKIPVPPIWGVHVVKTLPLDDVFDCISKNDLFRLSWGAKNTHGEAWEKLKQEFEIRLDQMRHIALKDKWLQPKGVYGYFPAQSDGNELIIYHPQSIKDGKPVELSRFKFPRQQDGDNLCLADYFSSTNSPVMDTVAFQIVTVGQEASNRFNRLQEEGNYSEAYFSHGLAVQIAEASAEFLHRHIRRELNMENTQGKRYSWGFPAIPDLADHAKVFHLLPVEKELGMSLTSAFQLVPEQSTAAIIVHHPEARYYNIGESRMDQLMKG